MAHNLNQCLHGTGVTYAISRLLPMSTVGCGTCAMAVQDQFIIDVAGRRNLLVDSIGAKHVSSKVVITDYQINQGGGEVCDLVLSFMDVQRYNFQFVEFATTLFYLATNTLAQIVETSFIQLAPCSIIVFSITTTYA